MKLIIKSLLLIFFTVPICYAQEYLYILNDGCILDLYAKAGTYFTNSPIEVIKDPYGLILRFKIDSPEIEYKNLSEKTYKNINEICHFLSKINNPAIIEVHTNEIPEERVKNLKKWEVSTVIANKIESVMRLPCKNLARNKIHSVGYGEFLPPKNTPNNGVNYPNRVDIMILCDIDGE